MRALHVIPAVAQRYGGPSQAVIGMAEALRETGVDVCIAATDADGHTRLPVPLGVESTWQGVPSIFFRRQFSEAFKYSGPLAAWLDRHVADYDVVHVHAVFSHACLVAAAACRRRDVPYIVRPLGTLDPWSLNQKSLRKRLLWHVGARGMLQSAAAVHYTTRSEQRRAEGPLRLSRGVVIPIGITAELFDDGSDEPALDLARGHPYVLILGRIHPKKGLEAFIDVFLDVAESDWQLVIAGDGEADYVTHVERLAAARTGGERVRFVGWLSGRRKIAALRQAELLALPSSQENFGIVVAEAMACGTAVLVSEFVNLADEIESACAGWVTRLDPTALSRVLAQALLDAGERRRRGNSGRALAGSQFRWPAVAERLVNLYRDVAQAA